MSEITSIDGVFCKKGSIKSEKLRVWSLKATNSISEISYSNEPLRSEIIKISSKFASTTIVCSLPSNPTVKEPLEVAAILSKYWFCWALVKLISSVINSPVTGSNTRA